MKDKKMPAWLTIEKNDRPLFWGLTVLYTVYVLPVILANRSCYDDISRSLYGITGWNNDARPLTEKLVTWLCGGYPLGNVSPLPLLLSVLLLAYTMTLCVKRYLPTAMLSLPAIAAGFFVIANPYFLSNLSYQFDCVTMTLALCAAILPYVVPAGRALYKIFLFSFFLCMVTFTTYQPCCGVYIGLWLIELFFMLFESRIDILRLLVRAVACGLSVLVYKYVVLNRYIRPANGGWQSDAYQFSWRTEEGILPAVSENFRTFCLLIKEYLQGVPKILLLLTGILLILGIGFTGLRLFLRKKPAYQKIGCLVYLLFLPVGIVTGSILPLLVLTPSIFSISAHSLVCLSSLALWMGCMFFFLYRKMPRLATVLVLPCLLFGLTFSYTYGNAMTSQKRYEEYLAGCIVHDVETLNESGAYRAVSLCGNVPRSPETARLSRKYPLFNRIVPSHLNGSSYIGGALLMQYFSPSQEMTFEDLTPEKKQQIDTAVPILSNSVYDCYENGDTVIIFFR